MARTDLQETRVCRLSTALPYDTLTLIEFSGAEYVNDINVYTVRAASSRVLWPQEVLGTAMQINIVHPDQSERFVHLTCYVVRSLGKLEGTHYLYEFELRPWFWSMSYRANSRIFHNKTVIEILTTVFGENGGTPGITLEDKTTGITRQLEYVVQYRESDLAFCRRLMEEVGINFHVEMKESEHCLVLTSDGASFVASDHGPVVYAPWDTSTVRSQIALNSWEGQARVGSFGVRLLDYNYLTPTAQMEAQDSLPSPYGKEADVVNDYPGRFADADQGRALTRRRIAGLRTKDELVLAEASHSFFAAGTVLKLERHDDDRRQEGKYVVLSTVVNFSGNSYRSGGGAVSFHSSYVLTREGNPVAPEQVTPRPRIIGPQTAKVVEGAETGDKHGRIKVKFHWEGRDVSILARVAQVWAGKSWGAVFVPRVGMEVVVEFLDGDPDRPLVTGCVYNAENQMPWDGQTEKHISGFKSMSMGGGGYNEFSLHDDAGAEKIVTHAQMDMETTVENNETVEVNKDGKRMVHGTETVTVDGAFKMESFDSIELKVGSSSIKIDNQGVTIKAMQVTLDATAELSTNGLVAKHKASGTMIIQAPIVNIN